MSGADEKMRAVLERVAEELVNEMCHPNLQQRYQDGVKILERRLLPLLLAGKAMRDALAVHIEKCHAQMKEYVDKDLLKPWDSSLAVAQGQPEKESGR